MNDCVFCFVCKEEGKCLPFPGALVCNGCEKYLSMDSDKGRNINNQYWERMREAEQPVLDWLGQIRDSVIS